MIEQAEILEHDPDAPPQRGQRILAQRRDVMAEQGDQPARRPQREEQETQQRALAGAGGAGEELERAGVDAEGEVAQDLGTEAIAQSYMLEPDHVPLPPRTPPRLLLPSAAEPATTAGTTQSVPPASGQRSASIQAL